MPKNSAANKIRDLRKEYRREDQYVCIEIQPQPRRARVNPPDPLTRGGHFPRERWRRERLGRTCRVHPLWVRVYIYEVFERSRSKSSPLEKPRSKLSKPVELSWGLAGVSTGVASFDGDLLIGIFQTGFTLNGLYICMYRVNAQKCVVVSEKSLLE